MRSEYALCAMSVTDESVHVQHSTGPRGVRRRWCLHAPLCAMSDECMCLVGGICCFGLVACETCFGLCLGTRARESVSTHT